MSDPALLVIDVQKGLDDPALGQRNNPDAESNIARLLSVWRENGLTVLHVRHCSVEPGSALRPELPGNAFKDEVTPLPHEKQFTKTVNSAFIGTDLEQHLRDHDISSLVVVGLTTDQCVSTSVRMAGNLGFEVTLIADATAAFGREGYDGIFCSAEDIHRINLVSLDVEFCSVRTTREVIEELR